jgi:hypothetical protein
MLQLYAGIALVHPDLSYEYSLINARRPAAGGMWTGERGLMRSECSSAAGGGRRPDQRSDA